jgi:predicted peroxiredoxin
MIYPGPILEAERTLGKMTAGQVLEVITTDKITDETDGEYRFFVRPGMRAAEQAETPKVQDEKLFLVTLVTGFDYTPIVRSAFMYASLAAAMGFETIVYCVQAGADTMVADKIDTLDQSKPGKPTIRQRFNEAVEMEVRVEVCEQTAYVRGIRAEDLLDGVTLRGGAVLIDYAARATGQLTF